MDEIPGDFLQLFFIPIDFIHICCYIQLVANGCQCVTLITDLYILVQEQQIVVISLVYMQRF